jgi:hypothetical protein
MSRGDVVVRHKGHVRMRRSKLARAVGIAVLAASLALPASASPDASRMLNYLNSASEEDAAEYLAFLIRVFGCQVKREERDIFNASVVDHLWFDFGLPRADVDDDGAPILTAEMSEGLFAFSLRAGPYLLESGELTIDSEGNARLLTCSALIS